MTYARVLATRRRGLGGEWTRTPEPSIGAALLASLLFGVYHIAHSPPFNSFGMIVLLSAVGLATSLYFRLSGDVYATIVFHNFLALIGVLQALAASGGIDHYTIARVPVDPRQPPMMSAETSRSPSPGIPVSRGMESRTLWQPQASRVHVWPSGMTRSVCQRPTPSETSGEDRHDHCARVASHRVTPTAPAVIGKACA
jgi:hypothetical protein